MIHGAAGSVGLSAVQLAHRYGAHAIATTSGRTTEFVRQLGADEVIGYTTSRFEDHVENVEMVFNAVGGDTLDRSWAGVESGRAQLRRQFDLDTLRGPAITEIDSPPFRGGCRPIGPPDLVAPVWPRPSGAGGRPTRW